MAPSRTTEIAFDKYYNIIDGQKREAKEFYHGINPATSEKLWPVPVATEQDVDDAVKAARKAFPAWRDTPIDERAQKVMDFVEAYSAYVNEFTELMIAECGKPVSHYLVLTHCCVVVDSEANNAVVD
jgi:acyl-CoA reductase-like NAD-dependent aldehyde dehydrogenase